MTQPNEIPNARICVLRYPNEVQICGNEAGFRSLGDWIAWLCKSNPKEQFHFHLLWSLESEASRFEGFRPQNVWFLDSPSASPDLPREEEAQDGATLVKFEVTFQMLDDAALDELAAAQEVGLIPEKFLSVSE